MSAGRIGVSRWACSMKDRRSPSPPSSLQHSLPPSDISPRVTDHERRVAVKPLATVHSRAGNTSRPQGRLRMKRRKDLLWTKDSRWKSRSTINRIYDRFRRAASSHRGLTALAKVWVPGLGTALRKICKLSAVVQLALHSLSSVVHPSACPLDRGETMATSYSAFR